MRKQASTVVVRKPDDTGKLVTYMTQLDIARMTGMSNSTISSWSRAGIIRKLNAKAGRGTHVALMDVMRIKLMTRDELEAAGIMKTPASRRLSCDQWRHKMQDKTRPIADHHREDWDEYDYEQLGILLEAGASIETIAIKMGRTYEAVTTRIDMLRKDGELPKVEHREATFEILLALLTDDERKEVVA